MRKIGFHKSPETFQVISVVICWDTVFWFSFLHSFFFFSFLMKSPSRALGEIGLATGSIALHLKRSPWTSLSQFNNEKMNKEERNDKETQRAETCEGDQSLPPHFQHVGGAICPLLVWLRSKGLALHVPIIWEAPSWGMAYP